MSGSSQTADGTLTGRYPSAPGEDTPFDFSPPEGQALLVRAFRYLLAPRVPHVLYGSQLYAPASLSLAAPATEPYFIVGRLATEVGTEQLQGLRHALRIGGPCWPEAEAGESCGLRKTKASSQVRRSGLRRT